jgi:1-deoxy-D-xylulose-5-phosphate reductoisomerase
MTRSLTILGSTGSIGTQTLNVIAHSSADAFKVDVLTAGSNAELLAAQARRFMPRFVAMADPKYEATLRNLLSDLPSIKIGIGAQAVIEAAQHDSDITVASIVGIAGLVPTMEAIKRGRIVMFANKECLVASGSIMMDCVQRCGTTFLPVDSEHNAIFQVLHGQDKTGVKRIILTASGGPFRAWSYDDMRKATPAQAIAHPKWSMGAKISVDSATLMNKALEVIEAHHLFHLPSTNIDVLVHPQSVVHGMVEYADGSFLAQMGPADMRTPISVCLAWPKRMQSPGARLDIMALSTLDFSVPDITRFPALGLVRDVLEGTVSDSIVFNTVNEMAVDAFLRQKISFTSILDNITQALDAGHHADIKTLHDVLAFDLHLRQSIKIQNHN